MSAQPSFVFDSCVTEYVQACLDMGARIVTGKAVGMMLCPACQSEKKLTPVWDGEGIAGHVCGCGHQFTNGQELILTFN